MSLHGVRAALKRNFYLELSDGLVYKSTHKAVPELARVLAMLVQEQFETMIAFLHSPLGQRVRTNNHVERTNRKLRYFEKVRYKWRRHRSIILFLPLAAYQWWQGTQSGSCRYWPPGIS